MAEKALENTISCLGTDNQMSEEDEMRLKHFIKRRRVKGRWNFIAKKYKFGIFEDANKYKFGTSEDDSD